MAPAIITKSLGDGDFSASDLHLLASNGIFYSLRPFGDLFADSYLFDDPRRLLDHRHLFSLTYLYGAFLEATACRPIKRPTAFNGNALSSECDFLFDRRLHNVTTKARHAMVDHPLPNLEFFFL